MDRTERIRERVRRRYIAASSRARLIRERDDCNGEISSKWTLNSNDSSPHSSLPLISTPGGALARAFGYSSVLDLGPFYVKLRVDALFSYSQALNRADFEVERQTSPNFEPNAIPELQINQKLRVDASQGCFQA